MTRGSALYRFTAGKVNIFLSRLGLELRRKRNPLEFLQPRPFRTILDIGANTGQFAATLRASFPSADIHSFEPLETSYRVMSRATSGDSKLKVYRTALGDREGTIEMFAHNFTPSSSVLRMTQLHKEAFGGTSACSVQTVPLTTLDKWAEDHPVSEPMLIKIDVQGYERQVIRGGAKTVRLAAVLVVEVAFTALYEGQCLFPEVYDDLRSAGFEFTGMLGNSFHPGTGQILQGDAVFMRDKNAATGA
jgi:FkbM family methyltransferase